MQRNASQLFLTNDVTQLRSEIEIIKRDIAEKDRQIKILQTKVADYRLSRTNLVNLIDIVEKTSNTQLMTNDERQKPENIPHSDNSRIIKDGINLILQSINGLEGKFLQEYSQHAKNISEELVNIKNQLIDRKNESSSMQKEINQLHRLIALNQKENTSLQRIIDSLENQSKSMSVSNEAQIEHYKGKISGLESDIQTVQKITQVSEEKNTKLIATLEPKRGPIKKDSETLEQDIQRLRERYNKEIESRNVTLDEYNHVISEIKRGRIQLAKLKKALHKDEILNAEKANLDLKQYIEGERIEWNRQIESQIKNNKALERHMSDLQEEITMLKPYLNQIEKKVQTQTMKLPSYETPSAVEEKGLPKPLPGIGHKNSDDLEMKAIKKAIGAFNRKKNVSKSLNLRKALPPLK